MTVALAMAPPSHIICSPVPTAALFERIDECCHDAGTAGAEFVAVRSASRPLSKPGHPTWHDGRRHVAGRIRVACAFDW
jgi:hypothetical protein